MEQSKLFEVEPRKITETCRSCTNRERWQCGWSIIQYCGVRKSNRTDNGLLKIKVTNEACYAYKKDDQ